MAWLLKKARVSLMSRTDPRPHYGAKRRLTRDGYVDVWDPAHQLARADGYVAEHRKMAWDAGLFSDPTLEVHHENGIKTDNRLANFKVMTTAAHAAHHAADGGITNQYGHWPAERVPRHGTVTEYSKYKCRCRSCTDVAVERARYYRTRAG